MYQPTKFITRHRNLPLNYGNYYYFSNTFSPEELEKIRELGERTQKEKGGVTEEGVITDTRISEIGWIGMEQEAIWLYDKIADLVIEANTAMWNLDVSGYHDHFQYTTYYGGGGHYDWHTDVGPGMANRKISVVLQLSNPEDYTGGDLELNGGGGIIRPPKDLNTLVIFPSFVLHRVTPVLTGTRKSLVIWLSGPPLR